jgi:hypothetical protein
LAKFGGVDASAFLVRIPSISVGFYSCLQNDR